MLSFAHFLARIFPVLLELRVENYAVIDSLAVEFAPGLNLLTGETGAGKSILIGALSLLLGDKASAEMIRHGADKAVVSGVFDVEQATLTKILEANGVDADGGRLPPAAKVVFSSTTSQPRLPCCASWRRLWLPSTPRTKTSWHLTPRPGWRCSIPMREMIS